MSFFQYAWSVIPDEKVERRLGSNTLASDHIFTWGLFWHCNISRVFYLVREVK